MRGSSLRFLGTGTAFNDDARGSPCTLVTPSGGPRILVDVGPTAICRMQRFAVDCSTVDRVFVTHLHGDHTAGWPFVLLQMALRERRTRRLDVHGPLGLRDSLEGLTRLCYGELLQESFLDFEIRYHELAVEPRERVDCGSLTFDVLPMRHHPSSIGYRFHLPDGRVAVSGDTAWCSNLERLAHDSDLLVTECTFVERSEMAHLSLDEIRRRRPCLGPCKIALVHLTDEVAAALALDPVERVVATYDGLTLDLVGCRAGLA